MNASHSALLTNAEFKRRKPVWTAFSEFWLDTELEPADLQRIARVAADSTYSIAELRDIYLYEVALAVGPNLLCVAGEWAGFDKPWLHTEARKRAEHRSVWLRFKVFSRIDFRPMLYATEHHWRQFFTFHRQQPATARKHLTNRSSERHGSVGSFCLGARPKT